MDKKTYMAELERELRRLPKADRDEALLYYAEYFDDAGPEHETEALEELGSAKNAAEQILRNVAIRRLDEPGDAAKKGLSTVWIVILALCAAPVGLPISLTFLILGLTVVILAMTVFLVILITGGTFLAGGIVGIFAGIYFLVSYTADGLAVLGSCLMITGMGALLLLAGVLCIRLVIKGLARGMKRLLKGGKKDE